MKKKLLLLLLSLGLISSANAAVPPYIEKDTFTKICKKVNCSSDLDSKYITTYYHKQFHKALAISTYASGNKYTIDYVYWSYQYPSRSEAKAAAINGCRKSARNCEIFLVNNSYDNENLYNKLNRSSSTSYLSSNNIPANAHASDGSWICNTDYYRNSSLTGCLRVPANAFSYYNSNYWSCKAGYTKSGNYCVDVPANASASGSSWKCNSDYTKSGNHCILKMPANAYASGSSWKCVSGYTKSGNYCVDVPANAYASGGSWKCKAYYYKNYDGNGCIKVPTYAHTYGSNWKCNSGYTNSGNFCVIVPNNASALGSSWKCNSGYKKSGNLCIKRSIKIPENAYAYGSSWLCKSGYYKTRNSCKKLPANAYASGSGWKCNSGYTKKSNSCATKPGNNKVYAAASGTGFAVTSRGHVVTNFHVIDGCTSIEIQNKNMKVVKGDIIGKDSTNDLALIKGNFIPEKFYHLSTPEYRMKIEAIGHDFGRKISSEVGSTPGSITKFVGPDDNFSQFQISAPLQPGNSGGPIINEKGEVVGVIVAKIDPDWAKENLNTIPEGIGFGIKSNTLMSFLDSHNVDYSVSNVNNISNDEINDLIFGGTYYLSCLMTVAQIEKMKTKRVLFSNFQ